MRNGCLLGVVFALTGAACGSSPPCENGTAEGSVWIENDDDLRAMVGCTHVKGHLVITKLSSATLAGLESLTAVDGKLSINANDGLGDISALASLTSVGSGHLQGGGELSIDYNPLLTTASFPALTSLGDHLALSSPALASVDFPALTSIPDDLFVSGTALTSLAGLGTVTSIAGSLRLIGNTALSDTAGLAGLTDIGADLMVNENPAMATLSLPALASVGASGPPPGQSGPSSRQFYVASNPMLTRIDVPALTFVGAGGVRINNNAALPQCQADAVAAKTGKTCDCAGNAGAGSCP